jgi:geranylgeranyl diphosphate synthase type I
MAFETRSSVTEEQCLAMAAGKTGALLSCAASLGAILAEAPEVTIESLADFGHHVGIAFQAIDDVLGIWGDPTQTGKPAGNDLIQHKKSLPVVCALARAGDRRTEIEAVLATDGPAFDVIRAVGLLEECGARDAVMALAESRMEAALGALDRADLLAGPRSQLEAIARYVTERDR